MRGISRIISVCCILSLLPAAGLALEPSNYIGFYGDMNRYYITLDEFGPNHLFEVYTWMYAGTDGVMCAQYKATVPDYIMVIPEATEYNTGVISHSGSAFGAPGTELCFDTCQEEWVFVSRTWMVTTTGSSQSGCGPLVTIAPHDETGVMEVADCGEPPAGHEIMPLDLGYINCSTMAVRYHPYIIDLDVMSASILDIEYHVEYDTYACIFHLYEEGDPSQSIALAWYAWQVYGSIMRLCLASPLTDGKTYILEAFGRSLNGAGMVSWKRFLFDASVATLLQSYDARYEEPSVVLSWELAGGSETTEFAVSRSESGNNFIGLPSEGIRSDWNRYTFTDGVIEPGKEYVYKVEYASGGSNVTLFVTEPVQTPALQLAIGNYPNPFNPSTTIEYTLPAAGAASIAVYDINGKLIRTLFDKFQTAGRHSVNWDGTGESGHAVSSGVYFCRIDAGKEILSKKMILVR